MTRFAHHLAVFALAACVAIAGSGVAAAETVTLPVPSLTIYPGGEIDAGQLSTRSFDQQQVASGYIDSSSALIGKIARRTLLPGYPIPINAVHDPALVTRGMPVELVFAQGRLVITAYASPLQDGSEGDLIRVRNEDSGAIVVGIVQADGTVRVGPR